MHKIMYVEYLVHKTSPTNASCYYCHKTASVCLLVTITTATRAGSLILYSAPYLKDKETPRLPAVAQSRRNDSPQAGKPGGPGTVRSQSGKFQMAVEGRKYNLESR